MPELWDVYDENRNKTGKIVERGKYQFQKGEYHLAIEALIINDEGKILISQRAAFRKMYPLMWECNGGSALKGETSLEAILREMREELGIEFKPEEAVLLKEYKGNVYFKDFWIFKSNVSVDDLTFPDGEAIAAKWVTIDEMMQMKENGEWIGSITKEDYEIALEKIHRDVR